MEIMGAIEGVIIGLLAVVGFAIATDKAARKNWSACILYSVLALVLCGLVIIEGLLPRMVGMKGPVIGFWYWRAFAAMGAIIIIDLVALALPKVKRRAGALPASQIRRPQVERQNRQKDDRAGD